VAGIHLIMVLAVCIAHGAITVGVTVEYTVMEECTDMEITGIPTDMAVSVDTMEIMVMVDI